MALTKSNAEDKAEVLLRVMRRGRASVRETAILLGKSWSTTKAHVDLGKIESIGIGKRLCIPLEELVKHGLVLPNLPDLKERVTQHLQGIDSNLDDLGDH
jgi:hypothetical protein